ncbi:MAG: hypothetical protein HY842_11515 [Bacteroidetes bacterium]|nr:hypothetical protein [Bacteroidota bacterium]
MFFKKALPNFGRAFFIYVEMDWPTAEIVIALATKKIQNNGRSCVIIIGHFDFVRGGHFTFLKTAPELQTRKNKNPGRFETNQSGASTLDS